MGMLGGVVMAFGTIVLASGLGSFVYALFAKGRRKKVAKLASILCLSGMLLSIIGGGIFGYAEDEEARVAGGFDTIDEMRDAESVGAETKVAYDAHLQAQREAAARQAAEEATAAAAREAEEKRQAKEAERQAAENAAAKEAACRRDLKCWAERWHFDATLLCERLVERFAQYDAEWTDGMLDPKLTHYRWLDHEAGTVTFLGDKVKFQNGFGAWSPMIYECDFDPETESITDVRVHAGRL